jgi:Na+/H+-translocating membrane pyrophosphatase
MFHAAVLATGGWSLRVAGRRARWVREQDPGTERMREIARATQAGAMAFLSREYRALGVFVGVVTALLFVGGLLSEDSSFLVAVSFVVGAGCAAMAGYSGLRVATDADVRTANAARVSLAAALDVAFAGAVSGWCRQLGVCGHHAVPRRAVLFGDATRELHTVTNVLAASRSARRRSRSSRAWWHRRRCRRRRRSP